MIKCKMSFLWDDTETLLAGMWDLEEKWMWNVVKWHKIKGSLVKDIAAVASDLHAFPERAKLGPDAFEIWTVVGQFGPALA